MMLSNNNKRPKFLHLLKIAMPVTAVASFAHRVSGLLMVLATPALIYTLEVSLRDAAGYAQVQHWLAQPLFRLLLIVLCWALLHHLFAGVRFLIQDVGLGLQRVSARRSAWLVNLAALVGAVVLFMGVIR